MKTPNDTKTFHYFNANIKNKCTDDCVVRAIATATDMKYEDVARGLFELYLKTGYHICDSKCYAKYLESLGWAKMKQPRKSDNTKYTGKEFCKLFNSSERYIAHIGGHHIVAIVDGKVNDIWDSTDGSIGNYWVKIK